MSTKKTKRKVRGVMTEQDARRTGAEEKKKREKETGKIVSSGVPSDTPVGLKGQPKGGKQTAAVDPRTLPVWKGGAVPPGGIGVPPKKPS
jgi:hypothetical protein